MNAADRKLARDKRAARILDVEMKVRAYSLGFIAGTENAQHGGQKGRTVVEPSTHQHWRVGFDDGKECLWRAQEVYRQQLNKGVTDGKDES